MSSAWSNDGDVNSTKLINYEIVKQWHFAHCVEIMLSIQCGQSDYTELIQNIEDLLCSC